MIKKLVKHGNSYALVIDKALLEVLKVSESTPLEIVTDGTELIITPVRNVSKQKKLEASMRKADRLYSETFRDLAG